MVMKVKIRRVILYRQYIQLWATYPINADIVEKLRVELNKFDILKYNENKPK